MRGGCKDILYTHEMHCILFIGFILVIISEPQDIYIFTTVHHPSAREDGNNTTLRLQKHSNDSEVVLPPCQSLCTAQMLLSSFRSTAIAEINTFYKEQAQVTILSVCCWYQGSNIRE